MNTEYIVNTYTYTNKLHIIKSKNDGDSFITSCNKEIIFYYDLMDDSDIRVELYPKCQRCFKDNK